MSAHLRVSLSLQGLAQYVDDFLKDRAGERVSYVLMVNVDDVTQYVSNTDRKDGIELIESLLARWKVGRADIPAHYNPDLPANPAQAGARTALAAPEGPAGDMTVNELRAKLQDPVAVHVALVRGEIAKPPIRDMLHAYGAEALARWDAAPEAPPPVEARQPHNPWRASIENILTGDNYFRAAEWHELLADLDRLYAMPPAVKPLDDPRLQQAFGDAIEGALAFGYQQNNKPPVGHWLNRFWNIGSAEAEKASKPPIVTDEMVTAYLKANDEYWRKVDEIAPPIGVWRNGTPREATRESLRAALAAPAGAIQPHLDHQVGAPVTLSDAASEGWRRIESAPKDATPVLLYVPTRWNKWVPAVQGTGFWYASGWLLPNADEAFQSVSPTHWRPLHSIPRDPTLAASESVEELSTESTRTPLAAPQGGDTGAPS